MWPPAPSSRVMCAALSNTGGCGHPPLRFRHRHKLVRRPWQSVEGAAPGRLLLPCGAIPLLPTSLRPYQMAPFCGILGKKEAVDMVLWLGEGDAYALLGELLRAEYGLGVLPAMARGADGKPYFPGEPELHFNVSHSGGLALCGAGEAPLGVDVEVLRPRRPGLARYVCSEAESAWLERQGGDWGAFYTLWTLKEARVKCTGEGLRRPPRDIAVPLLRPGETGELDGLAFSAFFGETWRAAACCPTPQGPLELFVRNS